MAKKKSVLVSTANFCNRKLLTKVLLGENPVSFTRISVPANKTISSPELLEYLGCTLKEFSGHSV